MQFPTIAGWGLLVVVVGRASPILAVGPPWSSPQFLAGVCWCGLSGRVPCVFVVCGVCVLVLWFLVSCAFGLCAYLGVACLSRLREQLCVRTLVFCVVGGRSLSLWA